MHVVAKLLSRIYVIGLSDAVTRVFSHNYRVFHAVTATGFSMQSTNCLARATDLAAVTGFSDVANILFSRNNVFLQIIGSSENNYY